jgi:hypothetical protein
LGTGLAFLCAHTCALPPSFVLCGCSCVRVHVNTTEFVYCRLAPCKYPPRGATASRAPPRPGCSSTCTEVPPRGSSPWGNHPSQGTQSWVRAPAGMCMFVCAVGVRPQVWTAKGRPKRCKWVQPLPVLCFPDCMWQAPPPLLLFRSLRVCTLSVAGKLKPLHHPVCRHLNLLGHVRCVFVCAEQQVRWRRAGSAVPRSSLPLPELRRPLRSSPCWFR